MGSLAGSACRLTVSCCDFSHQEVLTRSEGGKVGRDEVAGWQLRFPGLELLLRPLERQVLETSLHRGGRLLVLELLDDSGSEEVYRQLVRMTITISLPRTASSSRPRCSKAVALRFKALALEISTHIRECNRAETHYVRSSLRASSQSSTTLLYSGGE